MKWIPTSVRMPSGQGQYLVTFPLCNGEPWVYILSFNKGMFYETDDEWGDVEHDDVTAWMPLPKPYTADTPQTDCETCRHYKLACELFSEVCKYEPITQTETQNSNLTFDTPQTDCQW